MSNQIMLDRIDILDTLNSILAHSISNSEKFTNALVYYLQDIFKLSYISFAKYNEINSSFEVLSLLDYRKDSTKSQINFEYYFKLIKNDGCYHGCDNNSQEYIYSFGIYYLDKLIAILILGKETQLDNNELDIIDEINEKLGIMFFTNLSYHNAQKQQILIDKQSKQLQEYSTNLEVKIKQIKDELLIAHEQVILNSKHAAMGEMISMIAHQWRQPLTRITAITSKISIQSKMNMLEADDLDKSISSINKSVKYMDKTIENFRSFFKPDKEISTVRSINLIHHLEDLLDNVLSKIDVTYNIEDIELNLFENEFLQVLINLIKNSSDVFEEQNIKNPKLIFDLTKIIESDIEYVNIIIKDNGGGIPKDIIDKIFNPYFSTKGKNGTGIGLYMSKSIIEKHHNGTMDVYNEDNGAVFNIKVPLNLNKGKNYE